jgi:hypothetical protein
VFGDRYELHGLDEQDAPAELTSEAWSSFRESLRILGMCIREAPEFAARKRRKAHPTQ